MDDEWQWPFFAKFLQIDCRNDSNDMSLDRYRRDVTFSCRTHSLIPYGLRAVLKLGKSGHSVFSWHQNRCRTEKCTASNQKPHCIKQSSELHGFFCRTYIFFERLFASFRCLLFNFPYERVDCRDEEKWNATFVKVNSITILLFH